MMSMETRLEILGAWEQEKAAAVASIRAPVFSNAAHAANVDRRCATNIIKSYEAGADYGEQFRGNLSELDDDIIDHLIREVQSGRHSSDEMYRNMLWRDTGVWVSIRTMNEWLTQEVGAKLKVLQPDALDKYKDDNLIRCASNLSRHHTDRARSQVGGVCRGDSGCSTRPPALLRPNGDLVYEGPCDQTPPGHPGIATSPLDSALQRRVALFILRDD